MFRRRKVAQSDSPKQDKSVVQEEESDENKIMLQNGNLTNSFDKRNLDTNYNNVKSFMQQDSFNKAPQSQQTTEQMDSSEKGASEERRISKEVAKRKMSLRNEIPEHEVEYNRRVSVSGGKMTTPKKKSECGTHVVSKSELWDTGNQHRCVKTHQKNSRTVAQDDGEKRA